MLRFYFLPLAIPLLIASAQEEPSRSEARAALNRVVTFMTQTVSSHGGYLWRYSADLQQREGEGKAGPDTIWVQPPGTPAVGMALLQAYQLTGNPNCLDAARRAAKALLHGQLNTGGWNYRIDFAPENQARWTYRHQKKHSRKARNTTVLDDNTTQSAVRFLMRMDQILAFRDEQINEAVAFALNALLDAQFDCGAWPQVIDGHTKPSDCPRGKARFPKVWSREYQGHQNYWLRPTLNDNCLADMIDLLFEAESIYTKAKFKTAALRAGQFLVDAQLPAPQPGWAQQYTYQLEPMWARKFEPAAVTGGEAQGVIRTLLGFYHRTADKRWLEPIPSALTYYERSVLPDGRLARFYEIGSNDPLYFDREYKLTKSDRSVPTHYSFKIDNWVPAMRRAYTKAIQDGPQPPQPNVPDCSAGEARKLIAALDSRGAWLEEGSIGKQPMKIISCQTFNRNLVKLAVYVRTHSP